MQFGEEKVAGAIHAAAGTDDPFQSLMRIVASYRRSQLAAWDQIKNQESADGPSALRQLLARAAASVAEPTAPAPKVS